MNLKLTFLVTTFLIVSFNSSGYFNRMEFTPADLPQVKTNQVQTITETMKVVKTVPATNTIVVSNSENHIFTVDPRVIDLSKFRAGDKVTATLRITTTFDAVA